jgi:hypothetical protein
MITALGKYEGELYATRYISENSEWCNDQLGECESFGWYGKWSGAIRGRGPFHVIIYEDNNGFVGGTYYKDKKALDAAWSALESEYEEYSEESEV